MTDIKNILLPEGISIEPYSGGALLFGERAEEFREAEWSPLAIPALDRYCALTMRSYFTSLPDWGSDLSLIKPECQFLMWQAGQTFGALIPLVHGDFRTTAKGVPGGLGLHSECGPAGNALRRLPLAYLRVGSNPYETIREGMADAVRVMDIARLRTEKAVPDFVEHIGWCTWDAFYTDVTQENTLEGLSKFREAGITPGFVIIDEGWQDCKDAAKFLESYRADEGFDDRRLACIARTAKEEFGVRYIGVWRTLFGALRGIDPEAPALAHQKSHLVKELFTEDDWFGVIEPESVAQFQDEYAAALAGEGIDFVKVDFQSSLRLMTYDHQGRVGAMTNWQRALQDSANKYFGGMIINCMCGSTDAVYNFHDSSVTRTSDDFGPEHDGPAHIRHIVQNAFNGLWMGEVCVCDWDMFWSDHPWAEYHAMARAVSGGPVYVSDKPDRINGELLGRLVAADGRVLRLQQPALPTRDVLFADFERENMLFKVWNRWGSTGVLGLFHPHSPETGKPLTESVVPSLVEDLPGDRFAVHSTRNGFVGVFARDEGVEVTVSPGEADILTISPVAGGFAPIGLVGKFNPSPAVIDSIVEPGRLVVELRGGGPFGLYCERPVKQVTLDRAPTPFEIGDGFLRIDTGSRADCRLEIHTG